MEHLHPLHTSPTSCCAELLVDGDGSRRRLFFLLPVESLLVLRASWCCECSQSGRKVVMSAVLPQSQGGRTMYLFCSATLPHALGLASAFIC